MAGVTTSISSDGRSVVINFVGGLDSNALLALQESLPRNAHPSGKYVLDMGRADEIHGSEANILLAICEHLENAPIEIINCHSELIDRLRDFS